jgi:hypothetical protein
VPEIPAPNTQMSASTMAGTVVGRVRIEVVM